MEPSNNFHNWSSEPLFPVTFTASVAGIEPGTLNKWLGRYREDIKPWEPKGLGQAPEGEGLPAYFKFEGVLHIAATAQLVRAGVGVLDAYWAVAAWTMVGKSAGYWVGEPGPKLERLPAELFPLPDHTFLIHYGGPEAKVVRVPLVGGRYSFECEDIAREPTATPPIVLQLNYLHAHVRRLCAEFLGK